MYSKPNQPCTWHQWVMLGAIVVVTTACAVQPAPTVSPAVAPSVISPTAIPSPTSLPTSSPSPIVPSATATMLPTVAAPVSWLRDPAGCVLGGAAPLLNYKPDLITGQPCKRVLEWTMDTIQMPNGTSAGVVADPCVIQNVIDDFALASGFDPTWLAPDAMRNAVHLYKTDPVLSKVFSAFWVDHFIAGGKYVQTAPRAVCDKPVYRLLNVAQPIPTINSNAFVLQINYLVVARGYAPFRCDFVDFGLGQPFPKRELVVVTADSLRTPDAYPDWLAVAMWNRETQHWQFQSSGPMPSFVDAQRVEQLYATAEVKPW